MQIVLGWKATNVRWMCIHECQLQPTHGTAKRLFPALRRDAPASRRVAWQRRPPSLFSTGARLASPRRRQISQVEWRPKVLFRRGLSQLADSLSKLPNHLPMSVVGYRWNAARRQCGAARTTARYRASLTPERSPSDHIQQPGEHFRTIP